MSTCWTGAGRGVTPFAQPRSRVDVDLPLAAFLDEVRGVAAVLGGRLIAGDLDVGDVVLELVELLVGTGRRGLLQRVRAVLGVDLRADLLELVLSGLRHRVAGAGPVL